MQQGEFHFAASARLTLRELLREHYRLERLCGCRDATLEQHELAITALEKTTGRELRPAEVNAACLSAHFERLVAAGHSPATANKQRAHLLALLRYAQEIGVIDELPRVKRLPVGKQQHEAWWPGELDAILAAAVEETGLIGGVAAALWWPAFLLTDVNTGVRVSALMAARTAELDTGRGQIVVRWDTQKQRQDQGFDLWPVTAQALRSLDAHGRGLAGVFDDWPYDRGGAQWTALGKCYKRILRRAGLPWTRRDLFHKLRRTFATWFVRETGSIERCQMLLGHSTPEVTKGYLDWRQIKRDNVATIIPPPNFGARKTVRLYKGEAG